jgi:kynurenine formamidase
MADSVIALASLLEGAPSNWGRWGADDQVGCLNLLDPAQVLRGVAAVRHGRVFTLQMRIGEAGGELMYPGRASARHVVTQDRQSYLDGRADPLPGGLQYADDAITMYLQGTTHVDGLGHAWYGDQIWNGVAAETTNGGMEYASVLPIAERGIVGHGVLLDMARHRGKDLLGPGETFGHEDLLACASAQGVAISGGDIILIRTGWPRHWHRAADVASSRLDEPGLRYSAATVNWFRDTPIPVLVTDTIASEATRDAGGAEFPLHGALMRNLGVVFTELAHLDDLAADCARDRQYTFLYTCAPLKIVAGTGGPANPVVIK